VFGCDTLQARQILAGDVIVRGEVSILAPWVANQACVTLQSISLHIPIQFGRKAFFSLKNSDIYLPQFRISRRRPPSVDQQPPLLALNSKVSVTTAIPSKRQAVGLSIRSNRQSINQDRESSHKA
jgi:hypothetical protein